MPIKNLIPFDSGYYVDLKYRFHYPFKKGNSEGCSVSLAVLQDEQQFSLKLLFLRSS